MKKFMNKLRKNNKGFTLVELIIVVAIIAVLSAVLVPQYIQYVEKSRIGADESYISEVAHNMQILAASDAAMNNEAITIKIAKDAGTLSAVTTGDPSDKMLEELQLLFTSPDLVSNHYKANDVTIRLAADGTITYQGAKNLTPVYVAPASPT